MAFKLDSKKAQDQTNYFNARAALKPVGYYKVQAVAVHPFVEDDQTPRLSFELKVLGLLESQAGEYRMNVNSGAPVFANSRLFFTAYLTEEALWALTAIMSIMVPDEALAGEELSDKLNSFAPKGELLVLKLVAWVNSWLDTETEYVVYVNHSLKSKVPAERVHWQNR